MQLLLTGASGFIGRNFLLRLPTGWRILALYCNDTTFPAFVSRLKNPGVTAARCDLTDTEQVSALLGHFGFEWDTCLFLSAKVDVPWSVREPMRDLMLNAGSLLNLLERIRCQQFLYFSSGAVYDSLQGEVHADTRIMPSLPYAITKQACEQYVQFYRSRRNSIDNYLIVRFFGAYGPYEAPHKIYTRLIRTFAIEGKDSYTLYGDGQNLIDAMYVDDAIDAIQRILTGAHWNDTINLASGNPVTIETLVRYVSEILDMRHVRIEKGGIAHEHIEFWASVSEMQTYFGFKPRIPLAEGIMRLKEFLVAGG